MNSNILTLKLSFLASHFSIPAASNRRSNAIQLPSVAWTFERLDTAPRTLGCSGSVYVSATRFGIQWCRAHVAPCAGRAMRSATTGRTAEPPASSFASRSAPQLWRYGSKPLRWDRAHVLSCSSCVNNAGPRRPLPMAPPADAGAMMATMPRSSAGER